MANPVSSRAGRFSAIFFAFALFTGVLHSGCTLTLSPPEHRARQYSAEFAAYPPEMQERLRGAAIATGDGRTAVYIALGKPQATRIGYGRNETTGKAINLEYWEYSGYPTGKKEGQFVTLNNGGFASPLGVKPYGKIVIRFAEARVLDYSYDAAQEAAGNGGGAMAVPPQPHR